jgi:gamma-glutamyltranspeptidase/glutathione hydrolase
MLLSTITYLGLASLVSASPVYHLPPGLVERETSSYGKHGAVATEVKECSDLGVELLKKGGNAADAVC